MKSNYYPAIFIFLSLQLTLGNALTAQSCLEIRSILVDACGSPEGENEMVRFDIGNAPLNVSDLVIQWPNTSNAFQGICQDSITAAKVDSLNNGIQGCGLLVEPVSGILPANSKVLLITSTNFSTTFNSFANLNDTLIIIFQCAANTSGHFANYNSVPGLRTLIISFSNPTSCVDSDSYDRSLLVNQGGGSGGSSSYNDGALVQFDDAGNATYLNYGCQALVSSLNTSAGNDILVCNPGPINLTATVTGNYATLQWNGGTGTFTSPNTVTSGYIPGSGETGWIPLWLTASDACGSSSTDTVYIYLPPTNPAPILNAAGFTITCTIQSTSLIYDWLLNGSPTIGNSYVLNAPSVGCYSVIVTDSNGCSITSDTVCIINTAIDILDETGYIMLQSNPVQDFMVLKINSQQPRQLYAELTDLTGKCLFKYDIPSNAALAEFIFDTSTLSKGIYFLKVAGSNKHELIKVLKMVKG